MHGGALGSGAPLGNQNALKQGHFTRQCFAERQATRELLQQSRQQVRTIEDIIAQRPAAGRSATNPQPELEALRER